MHFLCHCSVTVMSDHLSARLAHPPPVHSLLLLELARHALALCGWLALFSLHLMSANCLVTALYSRSAAQTSPSCRYPGLPVYTAACLPPHRPMLPFSPRYFFSSALLIFKNTDNLCAYCLLAPSPHPAGR